MISVTESAAAQIKASLAQAGEDGMLLRLSVRVKSDGSMDYLMGFDESKATDTVWKDNDVEVAVSKEEEDLIAGTTIDFVEIAEGQKHFIFLNPNDSNYTPPPKKFKG